MGRSLEQAVHEMDLPRPGAEGEDFSSYISRVAHAAAFVGAAWAIANGPQVQVPPRPTEPEVHEEHEGHDDHNPSVVDDEEQRSILDILDGAPEGVEVIHQDAPTEEVRER